MIEQVTPLPRDAATGLGSNRWVATLAHELRGPLGAVLLALDQLESASADPAVREARELAARESWQMARIIEDVLDLCRSAHGKAPVREGPVDVAAVVAGAAAATRPLIAARGHRLNVVMPPDLGPVRGQASRLQQVLTNLLTNAAKFTRPGGEIRLAVEASPQAMTFRVSDDGVGIAPELLPHLFDEYRQGAACAEPPQPGLGLGLALVESLVRLMGGRVWAHSDGPGTGAEFVVCLPTRPATA